MRRTEHFRLGSHAERLGRNGWRLIDCESPVVAFQTWRPAIRRTVLSLGTVLLLVLTLCPRPGTTVLSESYVDTVPEVGYQMVKVK